MKTEEIEKHPEMNTKSLNETLKIGVGNGYSVEEQLNIVRAVLINKN